MMVSVLTEQAVLATVVIAITTFLTRAGMLVAGDRLKLSHSIEAALRFAPACALTALVLPEIVYTTGAFDLSLDNPRWPAALAATLLLIWRHSIIGAIALGMTVYAVCRVL